MRVTTKGRYALRAMIRLGLSPAKTPVSIRTLSEIEELSPEFLEQIFFSLRKGDLIRSTRGPGGGFCLNREPREISILDIFDAVGECVKLSPCVGDDPEDEVCSRIDRCVAHDTWQNVNDIFRKHLAGISLEAIIDGLSEDAGTENRTADQLS